MLHESPGPRRFLVKDPSGRRFVALVSEAGRLTTLEAAKGIKHRHLASVVEVMRDQDGTQLPEGVTVPPAGGLVLAEYIPGVSLRRQLEDGPINPVKAVAWTLRLAEAVQALHQAGGAHGAISPRSVVAAPEGRKIAPVLSQLVAPPIGACCPPERLRGSVETFADDVWALHAVLFAMLTGKLAFEASERDVMLKSMLSGRPPLLSNFGLRDPVLEEILRRGLIGEKRLRTTDLGELMQMLDGWERDPAQMPPKRAHSPRVGSPGLAEIVGGVGRPRDDGILLDDRALSDEPIGEPQPTAPPQAPVAAAVAAPVAAPTPAPIAQPVVAPAEPQRSPAQTAPAPGAAPAPVTKRISINPFEKKKHIWPLVLGAALAGGGGVYLAVAPDAPPPAPPSAEPPKPPPPPVAAPAKAVPKRSVAEERDACVVAYFPDGAFKGTPNFEFVCTDKDFRDIASALNEMVSAPDPAPGSGGSAATGDAGVSADVLKADAGLKGSGLDWYELPATAIIRRHCCVAAAPLTLPESAGWCEQLQSAVRRIADDSSKAVDLAPAARDFDKAVNCLFANKIARPYAYEKPPSEANRAAFQQFLGRAAVSDARR